ncbi:winged helix-turn-helix transcriptional regulator [Devosia albogilva]|jgi:DNA-binding HxlR family transcriptional regulator|uniref:Winged helix-turn-helix transcriptional regulator n=1 Tax=Devosia albogilva TaxID=429726 RepID=A0ABW5QKR8_9HYPH
MSAISNSRSDKGDRPKARSGKWTMTIITLLRDQPQRFNALRRQTGISQKTLTTTLRELERNGFVLRTMFATIPPRVEYELTELGRELLELSEGVRDFFQRRRPQMEAARERFDASGGEPEIRLNHP